MFAPVYLDYNATTPLDPVVLEAMLPWLSEQFGNASSRHEYGRAARRAIDEARGKVAAAVDNVETSVGGDGLPAALRHLSSVIGEANTTYERRKEVLATQ